MQSKEIALVTCLLGRWRLPENCTYLADVWCDLLSVQGFLGGSGIKNPPANAGDMGLIPGWGRSPGEGMGTRSCILAWEIRWAEEPGGLHP